MTSAARPTVFGAGLIALDLVVSMNPKAPVRAWAGGTCGNVLSILAYFGWDAYPIARMNDDAASVRVRNDMKRWGVRLDFASCHPTSHTPMVVQEIRSSRDGSPTHRFSWYCRSCGKWLPGFRSVTTDAIDAIAPALHGASVFFMDRLSRATLTLAKHASKEGAVVVFEPSGKSNDRLFAEALSIAHIVKYAEQRMEALGETIPDSASILVEVQTQGAKGLRYRHRFRRTTSKWMYLDALPAPRMIDSCGAGDWCTAGFLAKTAVGGHKGLRQAGARGVRAALKYGQALAAWNCGFEGARGGMYVVDQVMFGRQIEALISGQSEVMPAEVTGQADEAVIACPACA